jgi:hypothetical protein
MDSLTAYSRVKELLREWQQELIAGATALRQAAQGREARSFSRKRHADLAFPLPFRWHEDAYKCGIVNPFDITVVLIKQNLVLPPVPNKQDWLLESFKSSLERSASVVLGNIIILKFEDLHRGHHREFDLIMANAIKKASLYLASSNRQAYLDQSMVIWYLQAYDQPESIDYALTEIEDDVQRMHKRPEKDAGVPFTWNPDSKLFSGIKQGLMSLQNKINQSGTAVSNYCTGQEVPAGLQIGNIKCEFGNDTFLPSSLNELGPQDQVVMGLMGFTDSLVLKNAICFRSKIEIFQFEPAFMIMASLNRMAPQNYLDLYLKNWVLHGPPPMDIAKLKIWLEEMQTLTVPKA